MNISSLSNAISSRLNPNINTTESKKNVSKPSFKGIYIEDSVQLGSASKGNFPPRFLKKDALLLNEIANEYPNQDCFIRTGHLGLPRLEFREKPPVVQVFNHSYTDKYRSDINPEDTDYPCEPLIIYPDSAYNRIIGMTSNISLNPSLPYTIKVGFELHKKLLEKKYQIMDIIGKTDSVDLGEDSLIKKAHEAIKDDELAVTRYLLESAYSALTDKASGRQIYESNVPRVQTALDAKRRIDLTTSIAKQPELNIEELRKNRKDICEIAVKNFPNSDENKARIEELTKYMLDNGIVFG